MFYDYTSAGKTSTEEIEGISVRVPGINTNLYNYYTLLGICTDDIELIRKMLSQYTYCFNKSNGEYIDTTTLYNDTVHEVSCVYLYEQEGTRPNGDKIPVVSVYVHNDLDFLVVNAIYQILCSYSNTISQVTNIKNTDDFIFAINTNLNRLDKLCMYMLTSEIPVDISPRVKYSIPKNTSVLIKMSILSVANNLCDEQNEDNAVSYRVCLEWMCGYKIRFDVVEYTFDELVNMVATNRVSAYILNTEIGENHE